MTLKERIHTDFMEAFKAKDMVRKNFLGILKGEIQNEEGRGTVATDVVVMRILRKMEKSLKQTNTTESLAELEYIKPYLPEMMSETRIRSIIRTFKKDGIEDVGKMMGVFNKEYKGQADNALVSKIVKEVLA